MRFLQAIPFNPNRQRSLAKIAVLGAQIIADHAIDDERPVHFTRSSEDFAAGKIAPLLGADDSAGFEPLVDSDSCAR